MSEEINTGIKRKAEQLDNITKPIRNAAWLLGLAGLIWVQFIGPGLTAQLREMSGSNELKVKMQEGFSSIDDRLNFIEDNITPPKVALWNYNRQLGVCNETQCRVLHNISRTAYGQNCGIPKAETVIKLATGEEFELPFGEGFSEGEADLNGRNFIVPFAIPDYVPDGDHQYRFKNAYPTCEWSREPIPRYSPWFDLTVSR